MSRTPTPGEGDIVRGATGNLPCNHCVLLAKHLENATAEIERLRALVRPSERVVVRLG